MTELSLSAESIQGDFFQLDHPHAVVNLQRKQHVQIHAERLQLGNASIDHPDMTLEISTRPSLLITSEQLKMPDYQVRRPRIYLDYRLQTRQPLMTVDAEVKAMQDEVWGKFHVYCQLPTQASQETWLCNDGLYHDVRSHIPFNLTVMPTWHTASNTKSSRGLELQLAVKDAKFSDAAGLHAAERLTGVMHIAAHEVPNGWRWQGVFEWQQGELFWQPFYFAEGNKRFEIRGLYASPILEIEAATLSLQGVGTLHSQSRFNLDSQRFEFLKLDAKDVDFNGLYQSFIQPLLPDSVFGQLKVNGKADWSFEAKGLQPVKFQLDVADATVEDQRGKFGFAHLNAHIPWDYDQPQQISMGYASGHVLKIPLGKTQWQANVNRFSITSPTLRLPVLDGALIFEDVSAAWIHQSMVWHLKMDMQPISMRTFSQALGWPAMRGEIKGQIPLVTYANHALRMDGEMQLSLFKGQVALSDLEVDDPLGAVPKLHANLRIREIDMGEITRTFNFGSITGKLEGDVQHLRLQNWKPVSMNAVIQTADGPFEKKVSQRAVENITALGGEGTAAALQRTFLRFFKQFGYEKMGLSCELRGDVCKMGGVEQIPGGFVIVKGEGIPSVNVNGYTEYVSWKDMLARMRRITDSNSKMIVK
ncbi:hypothetical protein [Methylophilus sp. DW102]|uniref:hypothetical protein n=1 Tax=Methylophilus sp. DW102 TaxID=3095607 RepID=UPI0030902BB1|nr:YdbH domain-containing protein [Methylophilus sp. DW102]